MGRSVATQLAAKGANIVIVARNVEKLQAAIEVIKVRIFPNAVGLEYLANFTSL